MILAFDTSGPYCAAAVLRDARLVAARREDMARGQAERLMPLLAELLAEIGAEWGELAALGVGIGPGNFTGLRISVAAARGLALSLGVPAVGVSGFDVLAEEAPRDAGSAEVLSLAAPRGAAYLQRWRRGAALGAPVQIQPGDTSFAIKPTETVRGAHAQEVAAPFGARFHSAAPEQMAESIARVAARRLAAGTGLDRPAPLYVRPADAAPPRDPAPVILP